MMDTMLVMSRDTHLAVLIARTLRYRQVYCTMLPFDSDVKAVEAVAPKGLILADDRGGTEATDELDKGILNLGLPVLVLGGLSAAFCQYFGGDAGDEMSSRGSLTLTLMDDQLFADVADGEHMLHVLSPLTLPEELVSIATVTELVIGFKHARLPFYALQYPVERNDPDAAQILYNFACGICECAAGWDDEAIVAQVISRIKETVRDGRLLCAVSGGVDSAVCAKLAQLAVGDRMTCLFIDTGLFRRNEPEDVIHVLWDSAEIKVSRVDAKDAFMLALSGVSSAEDKERISSSLLTQILLKQISREPDIHTLLMGTNLNDTLYGFSPSAEIDIAKGGAELRVCEPVRNLFKDEIRRLAAILGLSAAVSERRPFPASGLALRVMGRITDERLNVLRAADACFMEEIVQGGYEKRLWQYYATLVEDPNDASRYAVCLRALQAVQGGAYAARLPFDVLEHVMERILREVDGVSRVVYDLTPSAHYGELE